MEQNDTVNILFEYAAAFVKQTNRHIFLTGKAGTGKTTFLKYIKENSGKKIAVLAPTGVAAINAGGVTIHSFFLLPFGTYIYNHRSDWGESDSHIFNRNQLLSKLRFNHNKLELLRELELLVIDEISMVRADVLDAVDAILRSVRRKPYQPFGGLQVLYIGDMFQLPPVVRQQEKALLESVYESPFFFDAMVVKEEEPLLIELKKIYRQQDETFISILNNIRNNSATEDDLQALHDHFNPHFIPDRDAGFITLTSHNFQADDINKREMERLPSLPYKIEAVIEKDFPDNAYPVDKMLQLKEGAQIMFIKNDKGESRRYYNGKIGLVEKIEDGGNKVYIRFKDESDLFLMEKETWKNIRYKYDNANDAVDEEVLGTFTQYPVRLAWAVTIHKSQGLTFDKAIIDAGQSFAPGQVYVALSRLTSLNGLVLRSRITPAAVMTDERVLAFSQNSMNDETLGNSLKISQQAYVADSLLKAFEFEKLNETIQIHLQETNFKSLADGDAALQFTVMLAADMEEIKATAEKFLPQLQHYLQEGSNAYQALHDRMKAAINWFEKNMDERIITPLKIHYEQWRIKSRAKKYSQSLRNVLLQAERKQEQLQHALKTTENIVLPNNWNNVMEAVSQMNAPTVSTIEDKEESKEEKATAKKKSPTKQISLEMFRNGKSVERIAEERAMAVSTIAGHLTEFIETGDIHVSSLVEDEKLNVILEQIKANSNTSLSELKSALGDNFSYIEIKAAQAYHLLIQQEN